MARSQGKEAAMIEDSSKSEVITANLKAMGAVLTEALRRAAEAHDYASANER
jgi:hypothetical protein